MCGLDETFVTSVGTRVVRLFCRKVAVLGGGWFGWVWLFWVLGLNFSPKPKHTLIRLLSLVVFHLSRLCSALTQNYNFDHDGREFVV